MSAERAPKSAAVGPAAREESAAAPAWGLASLTGRLAEVSGSRSAASLTLVFRLVVEAQRTGDTAVWIAASGSTFFPPDAGDAGADLSALPVVWAAEAAEAGRAADLLLRSGGFGLVVLDLGAGRTLPPPALTRLAGLAQRHGAALVLITEKDPAQASLGSLVSLRVQAARVRREGDAFVCEALALKDKRHGPGWKHVEVCRGPDGLC
jgi:recombination protein RecA